MRMREACVDWFGVTDMINRQLLGDFALAVALVLPTAAFAGSQLPDRHAPSAAASASPAVAKAAPAEKTMAERGFGLLG